MRKTTSRKVLAKHRSFNPHDLTSVGYDWTLYADGRVTAEYRSRWVGHEDGARFTTEPGAVDPGTDHLLHALVAFVMDQESEGVGDLARHLPETWRKTRAGNLVK